MLLCASKKYSPSREFLRSLKFCSPFKAKENKRKEISAATEVRLRSIRYDEYMPRRLGKRLIEWGNLFNLVAEHFQGDAKKTVLWFTTPNPLLGDMTPQDMIRSGQHKKLRRFICTAPAKNNQLQTS